ncbi:helix-turn-helix domain-containing protein [Bacillus altitudinis]|uniref:helix-turn-helix domain-containing protein n=1 Tax=Bacillus altitudinis TaxID=293387 RepID=UPI0024ACD642|nr:helix-turn-helix transcriptional regulator [Bacillus altitudinis]MDI4570464.1 helix-turn-helix transcriptional regulator [Bacillus altitudinis]
MFKDRLIQLRKNKKLTQEQMAEKIGIHRGTYANYERGHRQPDYDTLLKIADFFEVTVDYLLRGEEHYKELASEINKRPDTRYAAIDGHDFEDEEKDEILVNALKQIDGLEKIIKEHLEKKSNERNK